MSDKRLNEIFRDLAELKRRVTKLEYGQQELDNVVDPKGWIGEAFERLEEDIDERFEQMDTKFTAKFEEVNNKLDIILRHLTGLPQEED
jgi:flavorubredoxin